MANQMHDAGLNTGSNRSSSPTLITQKMKFKGGFKGGMISDAKYKSFINRLLRKFLERAAGIEPASSVWKTEVLTITQRPLKQTVHISPQHNGQVARTNALVR